MQRLEFRRASIHGHDVALRTGGSGPALLLVHGTAGSSFTWRHVMPALADHNVPTLIVWGAKDHILPAHQAHAAIPGSRLEIFEGVGHYPNCEDRTRAPSHPGTNAAAEMALGIVMVPPSTETAAVTAREGSR